MFRYLICNVVENTCMVISHCVFMTYCIFKITALNSFKNKKSSIDVFFSLSNSTIDSYSVEGFFLSCVAHRYLMRYRLSLQVFYLWRHVLLTAPPFTSSMVVKFRNTICPSQPQLSLHRRAALSSNSNGRRSVYSRKNPKNSLYCEISMVELSH
jgi:hypothetical protein